MEFLKGETEATRLPDDHVEMRPGRVLVALKKEEHESLLKAAGFEAVSIEVAQVHSPEAITE